MKGVDLRTSVFRKPVPAAREARRPRWWMTSVLGAIIWFAVLAALRVIGESGGTIQMQLQSERAGSAQWFYDRGQGYSERESVTAALHPGENQITFDLPAGTYRALRFDPINSAGRVKIESMHWITHTAIDRNLPGKEHLTPLANIDHVTNLADGIEVWPTANSSDPQMQLSLTEPLSLVVTSTLVGNAFVAFGVTCALLLMVWIVCTKLGLQSLITAGLFLVAGLILTMACVSSTSAPVHPDEFSHLPVFHYFSNHWLPPAVNDPAVLQSMTIWGTSYLFLIDSSYMVAGWVMSPFAGIFNSELFAARLFQSLMWIVLCAMALRRREWAIPLSVLLLSPQIWYIFSYYNADAFPLFIAMLATLLLCESKSRIHSYLQGDSRFGAAVLTFGLCLGLLLVCKQNYVVLAPGLLLWLGVIHLDLRWRELLPLLAAMGLLGTSVFLGDVPRSFDHRLEFVFVATAGGLAALTAVISFAFRLRNDVALRRPALRWMGICVLAVAFAAPRVVVDVAINGLPSTKAAAILAVEEAQAGAGFKPSEIARGNGIAYQMLDVKGVGLRQMLFDAPYSWLSKSLMSAFGIYGYFTVFAPFPVYVALAFVASLLVLVSGFALTLARPNNASRLLVVAGGASCLIALSSVLNSWFIALQPQGRYLFPILVMLALILGHARPKLPQGILRVLLFASVLLSVYSFVCVALPAFAHAN